jgi:hypothetical protein
MYRTLSAVALAALFAGSPAYAGGSTESPDDKTAPQTNKTDTDTSSGASDGASSGTSSSGNMQTKGVGEPNPDASGKNTNSDGSPGKNTGGPDSGPRQ